MPRIPRPFSISSDSSQIDEFNEKASEITLRELIAISKDFPEFLAHDAVREIEKLWPDLKADRIASQDIHDLANALRKGKIELEWRMLRAFLVTWKDKLKRRNNMSSRELADLAESVYEMTSRQLGPAKEKSSAADMANLSSKVDDIPGRLYTGGYYIDHFEEDWPGILYLAFNAGSDRWGFEIQWEKGCEECRKLWPDLEDELIPTAEQLKMMAEAIRAAHFDLHFRLLRAFIVGWMTDLPKHNNFDEKDRAERIHKMALAQMGPKNMVVHNDGGITILRREDEQNYNSAEDSDLDEEEREQARRHRLVTEALYPRNRPAPEKKRKRSSST